MVCKLKATTDHFTSKWFIRSEKQCGEMISIVKKCNKCTEWIRKLHNVKSIYPSQYGKEWEKKLIKWIFCSLTRCSTNWCHWDEKATLIDGDIHSLTHSNNTFIWNILIIMEWIARNVYALCSWSFIMRNWIDWNSVHI